MSKVKFPLMVKRGHTIVKIYLTPSHNTDSFTVVHYLGQKRHRKAFADLELAKQEAERVANKLSAGELNALTLTNHDSLAFARAIEALKPTGVPLEMAAMQFAEVHALLHGASLLEAVQYFMKHHPHGMPKKTVPEVVEELLAAKRADRMSEVYIKDLKGRLGRFAEKFPGRISLVKSSEIEDFLRGLKDKGNDKETNGMPLSGKSRNNYRRAIGTLFYFGETRGYIPRGLAQVEAVAVAREKETDIEIFTPAELIALLEHTEAKLVPFIAIGAFAGLRHAEIQRLDWSEVNLEDGFIEVKASKAKTAGRRLVPIAPNLKLWLAEHKETSGPVCGYANMSKQIDWLSELVDAKLKERDPKAGFVWKHNALRHSFVSYRVAQTQEVAKVALEAGNSPRMVFSNYRELVRPVDAEKWFGITPASIEAAKAARAAAEKPENVVELPKQVAA